MWTAKVKLNPVTAGFHDPWQNGFPGSFFTRHHDRGNQRAIRVILFDPRHLFEVGFERTIRDQLDVIQAQQTPIGPMNRAIARAIDVDNGRPFGP